MIVINIIRVKQISKIITTEQKKQEMMKLITENENIENQFKKLTADGRMLLNKKDLNAFQEETIKYMQDKKLKIQEFKTIPQVLNRKTNKIDKPNEYEYSLTVEGSWDNVSSFCEKLKSAYYQGHQRILNLQRWQIETLNNNNVKAKIDYKLFTE